MSGSGGVIVRNGRTDDLPDIARILVQTWRTTFTGILSDGFLDRLSVEGQLERHRRAMTAGARYVVAALCEGGAPIGFASGGANRSDHSDVTGEVYAIYVDAGGQRSGIGRRLMGALASRLVADGHRRVVVRVIATNPNLGFYERLGAVRGPTGQLDLGTEIVDEVLLVWDDISPLSGSDQASGCPCSDA